MGGNEKEIPIDLEWLCLHSIVDHNLMCVGFSCPLPSPPSPLYPLTCTLLGFASLAVTSIIVYLINLMVCTCVGWFACQFV